MSEEGRSITGTLFFKQNLNKKIMWIWIGMAAFSASGFAAIYWLQEKLRSKNEMVVSWHHLFIRNESYTFQSLPWKWSLFVLHCLVWLGLSFVLFQAECEAPGERVIFVLDSTLSMDSQGTVEGKTRFEEAQQFFLDTLDHGVYSEVILYTFGGLPTRKRFDQVDKAKKEILRSLPGHVTGNLMDIFDALRSEQQGGEINRIIIATDHLSEVHKQNLETIQTPIEVQNIGGKSRNIFISRLRIVSGFINRSPENILISYQIRNESSSQETFRYGFNINDRDLFEREITLEPHQSEIQAITLQQIIDEAGQAQDRSGTLDDIGSRPYEIDLPAKIQLHLILPVEDDLPSDNVAWEYLPEVTPLIVGVKDARDDNHLYHFLKKEFALDIPNKHIRTISMIDLNQKPKAESLVDLAILNESPPLKGEPLPYPASIYMLASPPLSAIKLPQNISAQDQKFFIDSEHSTLNYLPAHVAIWDRSDELMDYLNDFSIFQINASIYPFNWFNPLSGLEQRYSPNWIRPVIVGRFLNAPIPLSLINIPILMRGTLQGKHTVIFNFDITKYDLSIYKDFKILLINAFRFLHGTRAMPFSMTSGEKFLITWPTYSGPFDLKGESFQDHGIEGMEVKVNQAGVYSLYPSKGDAIHTFAIRALEDEAEHDLKLLQVHSGSWSNGKVSEFSESWLNWKRIVPSSWDFYLLLCLVLISIEYCLFILFYHYRLQHLEAS